MPITFGSVGDIIYTVQIAIQLLTALNESRGSASEFQELVKSLSAFHQILEQSLVVDSFKLVEIWPTRSECPQLDAIHEAILPIVRECREGITMFLDTIISRYGRSLAHGNGSRRKLKDIGKMLQWNIFESGAVARLQGKLDNSHGMISLAYMCAQGAAKEKDQALICEKLDFVKIKQAEIEQELDQRLEGIRNELARQASMLEGLTEEFKRVLSAISPITNSRIGISGFSDDMFQIIQTLYQLHAIQQSIPKFSDPYRDKSVILEDSLGYTMRIPLETIRSWTVVKQVLIDSFSNRQGSGLVRDGRYVLQDIVTNSDLNPTIPFHLVTRPGQKIVMTMVFHSGYQDKANTCPRCATVTLSSGGQDINCSNPMCDVTFRQVIEESEDLASVASDNSETTLYGKQTSLDDLRDGDKIDDSISLGEKGAEDGRDLFKRVRLFTRWQDSAESRGHKIETLGGVIFGILLNQNTILFSNLRMHYSIT
ncbi:hypothetical protein B0O99DRAFT_601275 [Bisporella sp. PMI_857]|nr:hypothetical protein B0O99DRAFT_601275 [Bisporella sp. PMI_857]